MRLPRACKIFVLKLDCEIPRGFGEIKVYTFGVGPSCADYSVQKPEVNRLRNDRDIAV